ncbi:hypothetical protein KSI24_24150, partial [Salmonella enterica subsp. enterica serovar Indiana]|nr:hypothetical protein [Salmonella enterica subsp. enterica serovar Indiana]
RAPAPEVEMPAAPVAPEPTIAPAPPLYSFEIPQETPAPQQPTKSPSYDDDEPRLGNWQASAPA